tara:strand:+ start:2685 stop:3716 length:1032 start_codon:yes stop_codon:yes gene_type:complete
MNNSGFDPRRTLESLLDGENLSPDSASGLMEAWLEESLDPVQTGAFLSALRSKGVTGSELSSMAKVLRKACSNTTIGLFDFSCVDTCGTGGDGADTFNISTAVAFTAASCGAKVAKHGNRSASGKVGSADVLEGLGVNLKASPQKIIKALPEIGITFLFAPVWHPSLVNLAPLRKVLGIRSVFNLLGPLVNPFLPESQVLGVARADLLDPMAYALKDLGLHRSIVVFGSGGLDEASLEGPNEVRYLNDGKITSSFIDAQQFGLVKASNNLLKGGDLPLNQDILISVLKGTSSEAHRDVVALNTAMVLWCAGLVENIEQGVTTSLNTLNSGLPYKTFENFRDFL